MGEEEGKGSGPDDCLYVGCGDFDDSVGGCDCYKGDQ